MGSGPTRDRPVGGSALGVVSVARPAAANWRAFAALAPKAVLLARARARRRRLGLTPIAVTGSIGKTTTKHLLGAALRTVGATAVLDVDSNRARALIQNVAAADAATRFLVQEVGAADSGPGCLDELLWALEPRVTVMTAISTDHVPAFGGIDGITREKTKAVAVLPPHGLAVLNADDPRVRAMARQARCRVVLVGRSADADVRIVDGRLTSNGRLVVRLADDSREHTLASQLIGLHWEMAVALAYATATRLGADPYRAADAIAAAAPSRDRLEIVRTPRGRRFLADTSKGTEESWGTAFAALAAVPAGRRIAVIGSLIDFPAGGSGENIARVTGAALEVADEVKLYGSSAEHALSETLADPRVRRYDAIRVLAQELAAEARPDDLVLVKGGRTRDHLARLVLLATHDVQCWRDNCTKLVSCYACDQLGPPLK